MLPKKKENKNEKKLEYFMLFNTIPSLKNIKLGNIMNKTMTFCLIKRLEKNVGTKKLYFCYFQNHQTVLAPKKGQKVRKKKKD